MSVTGEGGVEVYPGGRVLPDDPRYATLVRGFNLRWVGHPRYVELCGDTAQVVTALRQAVDAGLRVTVRGGGHCYEDFVSGNDGGVIIDLSPMKAVYRNEGNGHYAVEGGATLWEVYTTLYREYGVTIPAGSCYSVGAGGHVIGGGYGLLARKHGLTVDYLHEVEVVVVGADGQVRAVTVSAESAGADERDLLWAHQGAGGGNFGIVTRFWFKDLPQAPPEAWLLNQAWNWEDLGEGQFRDLVVRYGQFFEANSAVGSPYAGLFALLHLSQRAAGQIGLTAQYVGDDPALLDDFARYLSDGLPDARPQVVALGYHPPVKGATQARRLPWLYATQTLNGSGPNQRGKYKSAYMVKAFPEDQIATMWRHLSDVAHPNAQALLQVDSYGCQVNAVESTATPIPQRSSVMKLQYQTYWTGEADTEANLAWIGDFYTAMYGADGPLPDGTMDGCYVNYPDSDLRLWAELYYGVNYPRLQRVKARWDPHDIFHHRQSVRLPDDEDGTVP